MNVFQFGTFTLDVERFELTDGTLPLSLPRLALELLILLVRRRETLLTRADIAAVLWPHADPDDVTQSINTAINRIRVTLHDDPASPAYIQTVIGKGYRFIAPLTSSSTAPPISAGPSPDPTTPVSLQQLHTWYLASAPVELSVLHLNDKTTIVALRGALRLGPGLKLAETRLEAEIRTGIHALILDLAAVPTVDSAGLGLLLHLLGLMQPTGGSLRLAGAPTPILHLLRMTRTDTILPTDPDVPTSLAALVGPHPAP